MFESINIIEFSEKFVNDEVCFKYLSDIKWENGYKCAKCGHANHFPGKKPYGKCCTRCHYDESPTAHTMFHKIKFPLKKAFYILFLVSTSKKGISSRELSRKLDLRQKTCWLFKRKVMEVMKSSKKHPLSGLVEVDEFFVGGPEEGKKGRSKGKKRQVILALEVSKKGIYRSYAQVIPCAETIELEAFLDQYVNKEATIKADGWKGYGPLKELYPNLVQQKSENGKTFPLMHRQIMMIKGWLRGIHHQCKHLQAYLDEYNFRFNRRNNMKTIFHKLIVRMLEHEPTFYQNLKVT